MEFPSSPVFSTYRVFWSFLSWTSFFSHDAAKRDPIVFAILYNENPEKPFNNTVSYLHTLESSSTAAVEQ